MSGEPPPARRREGLLVVGAAEIATLAGGLRRGAGQADVAAIRAPAAAPPTHGTVPALAIWGREVVAVGPREEVERRLAGEGRSLEAIDVLDATGATITPGLVDPHTHLLFAGSREAELEARRQGAGYLEILAAGGGILSTVAATRAATPDELVAHGVRWLGEMLGHGATTVEVKSGYGLDPATELRLLAVAGQLAAAGPVDVVPTFLGAHAVPPEFRDRAGPTDAYIDHVIEAQLPAVAEQGVARFCDVFCETGVFDAGQSRRILLAARALGLGLRLHADELAPSGGAELAAELGATSADHLASPSAAGLAALAAAAGTDRPVVATLLPATTWFLMKDRHAPARAFVDRGVPVAIGTDFNPGTSPTPSLPLAMTLAVLKLGLSASEALAAVTVNAAHAVGLGGRVGALEPGMAADLVVWQVANHEQIPYWPAANLVRTVVKDGRIVLDRR